MEPLPNGQQGRVRVLIADDDPIFATMAMSCLGAAGFAVRTVIDGSDALEILERETFDVVLVDLGMPRIDGFRLIGLIRGASRLARLAILVVSSRPDAAAFEEALALGANGFQTKPINWKLLPTQVRYCVKTAAASARASTASPS